MESNQDYILKIKDKFKVEKILKGSLDSIPSPSPTVKIQIMGGKVCLSCRGKTLLAIVNKLLNINIKSLLTIASNVLPLQLKQTFPPIIWIFTEGEGDGIESRLPFKIFSTLLVEIKAIWKASELIFLPLSIQTHCFSVFVK